MLASLPTGEILWVNEAFEELVGYSSIELQHIKWIDLTDDKKELAADLALVDETLKGSRTRYMLRKEYRTKDGPPVKCIIDVIRYPVSNEFECFLVFVMPITHGYQFAVDKLSEIHEIIVELIKAQRQPAEIKIGFSDISKAAKEHPVLASIILTLLGVLLFGERVLEVLRMFNVFNSTN